MTLHRYISAEQRFWARVEKTDNCWLWSGSVIQGYGQLKINGKMMLAHRFSFLLHNGNINEKLMVLHSCDNPQCVNPEHLSQGTAQDNADDRTNRKRSAYGVKNGHSTMPERTPKKEAHYNYANPNALQKGVGNGRAKLTESDVVSIRQYWQSGGLNKSQISRIYGVSDVVIGNIVSGKSWKHVK